MGNVTCDTRHGGPFDRGSADAYYRREYDPHYYPQGTYKGGRVGRDEMTPREIEEYKMGWDDQTESGLFK